MWGDGILEGGWNADARTSDFSLQRIIPRSNQPKALRFELYGADSAQGAGSELYRGLPPVSPLIKTRGLKRSNRQTRKAGSGWSLIVPPIVARDHMLIRLLAVTLAWKMFA